MKILALDRQGQPNEWVTRQEAICYHAKNLVAWELGHGEDNTLFRGGENRITGKMSQIVTAPIIAVKGEASKRAYKVPTLSNDSLFARDGQVCAYCSKGFKFDRLTRDHIVPRSRGGLDVWTNVVTACERCNHDKDDSLLEECGMQLIYVPYTPNRAEALILENRNVLGCQMDYLKSFLPQHSRVLERLKLIEVH